MALLVFGMAEGLHLLELLDLLQMGLKGVQMFRGLC